MIAMTTVMIKSDNARRYKALLAGEARMGVNFIRDLFASITDAIGGRSGINVRRLAAARKTGMSEFEEKITALDADAIFSVNFDYEIVGRSMLLNSISGKEVVI
tara:strand:+ start:156 stop:467 length:312 start_codon:yes stop_codon:yes gene_type:complete